MGRVYGTNWRPEPMPYVNTSARARLRERGAGPQAVGELNYCLTQVCLQYLEEMGLSYTTVNDIVGALECAKAEFYRRVAVPYENGKLTENGDVYPTVTTTDPESIAHSEAIVPRHWTQGG